MFERLFGFWANALFDCSVNWNVLVVDAWWRSFILPCSTKFYIKRRTILSVGVCFPRYFRRYARWANTIELVLVWSEFVVKIVLNRCFKNMFSGRFHEKRYHEWKKIRLFFIVKILELHRPSSTCQNSRQLSGNLQCRDERFAHVFCVGVKYFYEQNWYTTVVRVTDYLSIYTFR